MSILAPTRSHRRYRLTATVDGSRVQRAGGRTLTEARARAQVLCEQIGQGAGAARSSTPVTVALEVYLSTPAGRHDRYAGEDWAASTWLVRRRRFAQMLRGEPETLRCESLDRAALDRLRVRAGTPQMVRENTTALRAFLRWGQGTFFSPAQSDLLPARCVMPAPAVTGTKAPRRRSRPRSTGAHGSFVREEDAPSLPALTRLAAQMAILEPRWGSLAVELAYSSGLRWGELFSLTLDRVHDGGAPDQQWGLIWIDVVEQVDHGARTRAGSSRRTSPKGHKQRTVPVPPITQNGFDLGRELRKRCLQVEAEHDAGANCARLLFPTQSGKLWHHSQFSRDMFCPAALAAAWPCKTWTEHSQRWNAITGRYEDLTRERRQWDHTWHSLRHRYARICVDVYGLSEGPLMVFGGWESIEVVQNRYYRSGQEHVAIGAALMSARGPAGNRPVGPSGPAKTRSVT